MGTMTNETFPEPQPNNVFKMRHNFISCIIIAYK